MESKVCIKCGLGKPLFEFYKHRSHKDGLQSHCKECKKKADKQYYQDNKELIIERIKKYRHDNIDKIKLRNQRYHQKNKERIINKVKRYYENNREKVLKRIFPPTRHQNWQRCCLQEQI